MNKKTGLEEDSERLMEQPCSTCTSHNEKVSKYEEHISQAEDKFDKNQIQLGIEHFGKALEISKQLEDKKLEMKATHALGHAYLLNKQAATAIEYLDKCRAIANVLGCRETMTCTLRLLGEAYLSNNQCLTAIKIFAEILCIVKAQADRNKELEALLWLGKAYRLNNQVEKSIEYFKKALNIAKELENKPDEVKILLQLGSNYRSEYQFQEAIPYYQEALRIAEEQEYKDHESTARNAVEELSLIIESPKSWKWERRSIVHREKFNKLLEYGRNHPQDIKEVNNVRVCFKNEFLIGRGSDGTRIYAGLSKDGYERAVKRLPKDDCVLIAEHEKNMLNEQSTIESKNVVNYRFLDDEFSNDWLYLIMDLCEENLKEFVERSSLAECLDIARDIVQQVLTGLADLHSNQNPILHRDLKPGNILRNVHGKWLLADFGLSRVLTQEASSIRSNEKGTRDWKAVESCSQNSRSDDVRYKKESDIQVVGMVAFYIVTKGEHPFGEEPDRLRNLLNGQPVGLDTLEDPVLKDLLSWMLSHDPKNRPSAEQALKHPYLQPAKQRFEMLCKVGKQREIKTQVDSEVVKELNGIPVVRTTRENSRVVEYLRTHSVEGKPLSTPYGASWTETLRLIRNVNEHWHNRPSGAVPDDIESFVGDPQKYFSNLFPYLPVEVHRIVRTSDWKERPDLKEYFI